MAVPLAPIPRNLSPAMQEAVLAGRKEVAEGPRSLARRGVREGMAGRTGGYPRLNLSMDRPSYDWVQDPAIMELQKHTYNAKYLP